MATPSHPAGPPATTDLRITVVGGGHVGLVSAVAFAALGNRVCVYDVDRARIDLLSAGKAPFVEPDLDELFGVKDSKSASGAIGLLTDGAVSRTDAFADLVAMSLAPWIHPDHYR